MATLFNNKISATYQGLIKTIDNAAIGAALKELTDGSGNQSGLYLNTAGDFKVTAILEWGSLKDTGTNITISKLVNQADGIANNNNDTTLPTSAAVKDYVDTKFAITDTLSEVLGFGNTTGGTNIAVSANDDITFTDSSKALFGASSDLQIYHDGANSYIKESGTGNLIISSNILKLETDTSETFAQFTTNGSVDLYYDNSKKFETTTAGVTITGSATISTIANSVQNNNKYLVSESGVIKYRTNAEVLADIGAGTGTMSSFKISDNASGTSPETIAQGDTVNIASSTGISTTRTSKTVTVENTDRGSQQNVFKNFLVPGQTTLTAANNNDSITFANGGNVTLTTQAGNIIGIAVPNNTNYFVTGGSFNTGNGELTLTGNNAAVGAVVDLDGRYALNTALAGYLPLTAGSSYPLTGSLYLNDYVVHNGDANTFFGFSSTDTIKFQTNGNEQLLIDQNSVFLKYQGATKLSTQSNGIKIGGGILDVNDQLGTAGQLLSSTGTALDWIDAPSGGSVGGSDTQLQYNNGGAFGGVTGFTYDDANDRLYLDTTRVVIGGSSSFQNGLTINDPAEFRSVVEFADGTASAPSITFFNTGDDNTGIFRVTSDTIGFSTAGTERFRINASGAFGLSGANYGTSGQVLTSNGSSSAPTWQSAAGGSIGGSGTANTVPIFTAGTTLGDSRITQPNSYQTVMSASGGMTLDVKANDGNEPAIRLLNSSNQGWYMRLDGGPTFAIKNVGGNLTAFSIDSSNIKLRSSSNADGVVYNRSTNAVQTTGNLGVKMAASYPLAVDGIIAAYGGIPAVRLVANAGNPAIYDMRNDGGVFEVRDVNNGKELYNAISTSIGYHKFFIDGTEKMELNSSGNLSVNGTITGTSYTSPANATLKLDSYGNTVAEIMGNAANNKAGAIRFNCDQNSHGVTIKSPQHSANATYTLTLPNADGTSGQVLSTDGSGQLSFITAGGGGASSLNGLSDVTIDTTNDSAYFISIPSGLSSASNNLIIGEGAGSSIVSSGGNTVIGQNAMKTASDNSRQNNTIIGYQAVELASSQIFETVIIGKQAGYNMSNCGTTTLIGHKAGQEDNQYGVTAIGHSASRSGNGYNSEHFGVGAGEHSNGEYCITIGTNAGRNLDGAYSIGIGNRAASNNDAVGHISIGRDAGYSNTSAIQNVNIGHYAGTSTSTNGNRVIIGYEAGRYNTGVANTFIGDSSGIGVSGSSTGFYNTAVGQNSLFSVTSGSSNTAVGRIAGNSITTGTQNSVFGYQSGSSIVGGSNNTFLGYQSGNNLVSGTNVTVVGHSASASSSSATNEITLGNASVTKLRIPGLGSTDGHVLTYSSSSGGIVLAAAGGGGASSLNGLSDCLVDTDSLYVGEIPSNLSSNPQGNTILGIDAGNSMTTQSNSTFIGNDAGSSMTNYSNSTAIGYKAFSANGGGNSVAVGYRAGINYTGLWSTFIGYDAGFSASSNYVVAIGTNAMNSAAGGNGSIAVGYYSLKSNTAAGTIGIGYQAGYLNTSGAQNTFIGYNAGFSSNTNGYNTVLGYQAMYDSLGSYNTFIGVEAGKGYNTGTSTASSNIAIGYKAMMQRRGGSGENVVIGNYAYMNTDGGYANVVIGNNAVNVATSGRRNVVVGDNADLAAGSDIQSVVLGYNATGNGNYTVTLGNSSTTGLHCQVQAISALSDKRDKTNIEDSEYGLDLIDSLKPVTFEWDQRDGNRKGLKDLGFIAQDLQESDDEFLQLVNNNNPDKLQASYGRLIPVLVKAIQELRKEIKDCKNCKNN